MLQNATYSDMNRQHTSLAPNHLERLAQSVAVNTETANTTAMDNAHANLLLQATSTTESILRGQRNSTTTATATPAIAGGRTLQDAIDIDNIDTTVSNQQGINDMSSKSNMMGEGNSILRNPTVLLAANPENADVLGIEAYTNDAMTQAERKADPPPILNIKATRWDVIHQFAETLREVLSLRDKITTSDREIKENERTVKLRQSRLKQLTEQITRLAAQNDGTTPSPETIRQREVIQEEINDCDRVISQLQRKLVELRRSYETYRSELPSLETKSRHLDKLRRTVTQNFDDPFSAWKGPLAKDSRVGGCSVLNMVVGRERGMSSSRLSKQRTRISNLPIGVHPSHFLETRRNIIGTRLSHAVTINTHMNCPIYCLRFDRTGRYFITGADDYLIKVFHLGVSQSCKTKNEKDGSRLLRCNYGANFRGAVLVCSLRGHAGVINDIDVSSDNCFLATASVDGDVRVWGLKDGSPVAILRGHVGGANMVTWSTLTPYRLVTTGSDGFARVWDIREACVKRYGRFVSQREEYKLRLTDEEKRAQDERTNGHKATTSEAPDLLPPLPVRAETNSPVAPSAMVGAPLASGPPPLPPLPVAAETGNNSNASNNNVGNDIAVPPLPAGVTATWASS